MKRFYSLFIILSVFATVSVAQISDLQSALDNFRYREALALLEKESETQQNLQLKASIYEKLYDYTAAFSIYNRLLDDYPDNINLLISTAECASQSGNTEQALKCWIKADSLLSDNQFFKIKKAVAYYRNGNWKETIEVSASVFRVDSVPALLRMVGDAYLYTSQADSAILCYTKAIEKNPSDNLAVSKLVNIYFAAKLYESVISLTDRYLNMFNSKHHLIGQLNGMAHYTAGNYKEAATRLKINIATGDSTYTTCYYLGMSLYASKLYFEATKWLEKAYEQNSSDINLLYYYGTSLSRTYNRKKGIEVLTEGVSKIEEQNAMLYDFDCSFAEAYLRSGNYTKAIDYYKSAFDKRPEKVIMIYNIAYAYSAMNDYKTAIEYYERFLRTAPKNIDIAALSLLDNEKIDSEYFYYVSSFRRIKELQELLFMESGINK